MKIKPRVSAANWCHVIALVNRICKARKSKWPEAAPTFAVDLEVPVDDPVEEVSEEGLLTIRRNSMHLNTSQMNVQRQARRLQGHNMSALVVGHFISYVPNYTADFLDSKKQDFWVGKIVEIDAGNNVAKVRRWHTNTLRNSTHMPNPSYKQWPGTTLEPATEWVTCAKILTCFDALSVKLCLIKSSRRKDIISMLQLYKTNLQAGPDLSVAVGCDDHENPESDDY